MEATSSASIIQLGNSLISLAPVIGLTGIVGYWIQAKLKRDDENRRKIRDEKEKQYEAFLIGRASLSFSDF